MDSTLQKALDQWRAWDKDEKTKAEIEKLVSENDTKQLEKLLCSRMTFGTAGLRSRMGAGFRDGILSIFSRSCPFPEM